MFKAKDSNNVQKINREIARVIEKRRDHYIAFLAGLLRFKTVSGREDKQGQADFEMEIANCLDYLEVAADRLNMEFRNYNNLAAVAELKADGNAKKSLGVAAHIDVVPADGDWKYPPFGGTVADGAIWGRGTQDDKGPVGAVFSALDLLETMGMRPSCDVRLLLGTLEETDDWPDVDLLREKGENTDMTIVPDGTFPIINAEKGMAMIKWDFEWPIPKGSSSDTYFKPYFVSLESGKRHNMIPELAKLICQAPLNRKEKLTNLLAEAEGDLRQVNPNAKVFIEEIHSDERDSQVLYSISFKGKSAHGAFPEKDHNAALDALAFIELIDTDIPGLNLLAKELRKLCSRIDGSGFGFDYHDDYMGSTTVNLGEIVIKPGSARAMINVRFPKGVDSGQIESAFSQTASRLEQEIEGLKIDSIIHGRVQEALHISPDEYPGFLENLQLAYHTVTGRQPDLRSIRGTTYAKAFPASVAFGPLDEKAGDIEMAHETNEHILVSRYLENIRIYALALALLAFE
ncbi:MAG: Sapep family Mn(2+)-dependent dipeptidase [candidate division Zixibacteria bacterium]|nr:Sapep family Mn(2+)-dependent dipeptidase [candidate division Zixibacteria bacterium]